MTSASSHTTAGFDARAESWDDDPSKVARAADVAAAIAREVRLSPSMRVLEYGAGTGLLSFMLRDRVGEIALADVSEGMLDVARRKIAATGDPAMSAVRLDLLADPVPEGAFDLVCSLMTLHHIGDTAAILRAFHRVLASPGVLCVADLDAEDGSFHGAGFDGHRGFDRGALATMARDAGFLDARVVDAHTMHKRTADGTLRDFPVFLLIALKG